MEATPPSLRPLAEGDHDWARALWNKACPLDRMTKALFREKLEDGLGRECHGGHGAGERVAHLRLVAEQRGSPVGFALGVPRDRADGRVGHIKLLATLPDRQGRGIGSALLAALEEGLAAIGCRRFRVAESAPNYLTPGLDPRCTRAWLFFERRGYQRFGETWNLAAPLPDRSGELAEAVAALERAGIEIHPADPVHWVLVAPFLEANGWTAWKAECQLALRQTPSGLHIARRGGEILGFAARDGNNVGTGWFGPMGCSPAARGQGIGRALLLAALEDLRLQGRKTAIIPWVGPVGFYARHCQAQVSRVFYRMEKVPPPPAP